MNNSFDKAVILAAGIGARLRPLTENCPKCLLKIADRPLLDYWLEKCTRAEIKTVFINSFYLAEQVENYLTTARKKYPIEIKFYRETELSGTGGFLQKIRDEFNDDESIFVAHGDNFSDIDIGDFARFHFAKNSELTLALFTTDTPKSCGIIEKIRDDGLIETFREKPENPQSNLASAAIFILKRRVLQKLPAQTVIDFSKEILPLYENKMYGYRLTGYNLDIGTPESYEQACRKANL